MGRYTNQYNKGLFQEMDWPVEMWKAGAFEPGGGAPGSHFQKYRLHVRTLAELGEKYDLKRAIELIELVRDKGYLELYDHIEQHPVSAGVMTSIIILAREAEKKLQSSKLAESGGNGRGLKFKLLEAETIKLYETGKWRTVPLAAQEITPKIVALSKNGNGNLLPTTTKPIEWIRAYVRDQKK